MTGLSQRAPAIGAGLLVGAVGFLVARAASPVPLDTASLLPHLAAVAVALAAALVVAARSDARLAAPARAVAVGVGVAVLIVLAGLVAGGADVIAGGARSAARGTCAGLGLAVWVGAFVLERRLGRRLPTATAVLVGIALAAVTFEVAATPHKIAAGRSDQAWNVYHYYMGSKYFPEIGYGELYAAHLAADDQDGRRDYGFVTKGRSMATYAETPRARLVAGFDRRALFSDARWAELRRDVHAFRPLLPPNKWKGVLIDLGYHPSPAWTVVGTPLANLAAVRGRLWPLVVYSDLPFHLLALVALWWAFGPRTTAAMALWLVAVPLNSGNFLGAFLRHDWLHSTLIAVALWHRGRPASAGVALAWGAMTRIFPGVLAAPILLRAAASLVRGGRAAVLPAQRRFIVALTLSCAVLFGASHLTGRGLSTWSEWLSIITKHGDLHPITSTRRIGLGRLVLHAPTDRDPWATVGGASLADRAQRRVTLRRVVQVAGLLLLVAAAWRRTDLDAMVLMTFAIFLLVTLSRYHGSIWVLLFLLGARGARDPTPGPAFVAGALLLLVAAAFFALPTWSGQYYVLNYLMLAFFVALCAWFVRGDRRTGVAR